MPGSSNILQFNPTQVNQESDAQYLVDPLRTGGAPLDALLPSNLFNKVVYQLSTFVAALAQMLATKGYAISDANISALTSVLAAMITESDLTPYALLSSPAFSGAPTTPLPSGGAGDNSTHIANTQWVQSWFATLAFVNATFASLGYVNSTFAPINNPAFSGSNSSIATPPFPDATGKIPNTNWVSAFFASLGYVNGTFAPLASPVLSGVPQAPTPLTGTRNTQIATTAMFANEFPLVFSSIGFAAKFPNGLIVQFMGTSVVPAGGNAAFVFPLNFPSACQGVAVSYTNATAVSQATGGNPANGYLIDTRFAIHNGGDAAAQYFAIAWGF